MNLVRVALGGVSGGVLGCLVSYKPLALAASGPAFLPLRQRAKGPDRSIV